MSFHERLLTLGIDLRQVPTPIGNFRNYKRVGQLIYISGQGPVEADGFLHRGKVGGDVSVDEAYKHARLTGLNLLSVLAEAAGGLDRVAQVVKLFGMVNAVPDFAEHPRVINGCSDLLVSVFGKEGEHARSSIGVGSLPNNITVEIEAIFELRS